MCISSYLSQFFSWLWKARTQEKLRKLMSWGKKPRIIKPGSYNPVIGFLDDKFELKRGKSWKHRFWIFRHTLRLTDNAKSTKVAVWDFGDFTLTKSKKPSAWTSTLRSPCPRQGYSEKKFTWHISLGKSWEISTC